MVTKVEDSTGTLRSISRIRVRDGNGILRIVSRVRVVDNLGTLRTVFASLALSSSTALVKATGSGAFLISGTVLVTTTGGFAPYTYAWTSTITSGAGNIAFTSTNNFTTQVGASDLNENVPLEGFVRCTVTDDNGTVQAIDIPFYFLTFDNGGGFFSEFG